VFFSTQPLNFNIQIETASNHCFISIKRYISTILNFNATMYSEFYSGFDVSELTYKVVNNQDIKAFVLVPNGSKPGKHPIVAKFHGGGFVSISHHLYYFY